MNKKRFLFSILLIAISFHLSAQQLSYLDSLSKTLDGLEPQKQIEAIIAIPYDKAVSDIKQFDELSDKAIELSKALNNRELLAESLAKKTLALHFTSKTDEAIAMSMQIISIYENLGNNGKVGETYSNLAWQLKYLDLDKAFKYIKQGVNLLEEIDNRKILNISYDHYGVFYGMRKQWDSALYYHRKSLKLKKQLNDSIGIPFGYSHLANVYLRTKKFNLAEIFLDSSLNIRIKRNDIYGITDSHLYFGDLYYEKEDYSKAIQSFEKGLKLSDDNKYYPLKKYAAEYLFKSHNNLNNSKEALKYHLLYTKLKDSILNIETNSKVEELEIEYQTEKKEKEIMSQRANLAENALDISKKNTYILGLTGLAIVLALLGYLLYSQQKLKNRQLQKENELKDALLKIETQNKLQEQRLRISRDLHDNIGAQLTFIISSLDNLKYGFKLPEKLSGKLKNISEFTTTTIYELRDTIWAMNKNEITFEDLQIRISNFIEKANTASENTKFQFMFDDTIDGDMIFSSVKGMNIYRIIQEALNNAIKYANATEIDVTIKQKDTIKISVTDNGIGFDEFNVELGNGLNNIKKRALEIDADLNISSQLERGTKITLNV